MQLNENYRGTLMQIYMLLAKYAIYAVCRIHGLLCRVTTNDLPNFIFRLFACYKIYSNETKSNTKENSSCLQYRGSSKCTKKLEI